MEDHVEALLRKAHLDAFDRRLVGWMAAYGPRILRVALAVVFIWFGILKPLGMSPAETLVRNTVYFLPETLFLHVLGWWEVAIGIGLLYRPLNRLAILLLFLQMPGTMLPLVLLPEVCFAHAPFGLTLEGQYIIKNIVLIGAALVVGGGVRQPSAPRHEP